MEMPEDEPNDELEDELDDEVRDSDPHTSDCDVSDGGSVLSRLFARPPAH